VADQGYDVVTAEIVRNGLSMAALEMNRTLVRTAFNSLLYEALDFGVGIVSRDGELWADAPGVAGFVVSLPAGIRTGLEQRGVEWFCEGDIVIHNDPYTSGTHISDTCIYMPIFCEGGLVGFSASMAHWADIGGKTPGGWCPDSRRVPGGALLHPPEAGRRGREERGPLGVHRPQCPCPRDRFR
jgi:N-methylhydantoinase B